MNESVVISSLRQQLLQHEEERRQLQEDVQIARGMFETVSQQLDQMADEAGKGESQRKEEIERMENVIKEMEMRNAELESQAQLSSFRINALEYVIIFIYHHYHYHYHYHYHLSLSSLTIIIIIIIIIIIHHYYHHH